MKLTEVKNNQFVTLRGELCDELLFNNLNNYIVVRHYKYVGLRKDITENVYVLFEILDDSIKVKSHYNDDCYYINKEDIIGIEYFKKSDNVINVLKNMNTSYEFYSVKITNIYGDVLEGVICYKHYIDTELYYLDVTYKYESNGVCKFDTCMMSSILIKDIEILDTYDISGTDIIIDYVNNYYNTVNEPIFVNDLNSIRAIQIMKLIKLLTNLPSDIICLTFMDHVNPDDLDDAINKIDDSKYDGKLELNYDSIANYLDVINKKNSNIGIGIKNIGSQVSLVKGKVSMLCGDSKCGKSTLALQIFSNYIFKGKSAMFISLECNNDYIIKRLISLNSMVSFKSIIDDKLDYYDKTVYFNALKKLNSTSSYIEDSIKNIEEIENCIKNKKLDLLVIDYISLFDNNVNDCLNKLNDIASKYDIAILVVNLVKDITIYESVDNYLYVNKDKLVNIKDDVQYSYDLYWDNDLMCFN